MHIDVVDSLFGSFVVCVSPSVPSSRKLEKKIAKHGALVVRNLNKRVQFFVCDIYQIEEEEYTVAKSCEIKLISAKFFTDCLANSKLLKVDPYLHGDEDWKKSKKKRKRTEKGEESEEESEEESGEVYTAKQKKHKGSVQVLKKGSVPVDPECIQLSKITHVLEEKGCAWSCMLNQTNINNNNNKFYTIQVLESDKKNQWWVWTRWGRVGNRGQSKAELCPSVEVAKRKFSQKFMEKTGNDWAKKSNFKTLPQKYTIICIDYGSDSESTNFDGHDNVWVLVL
eukprot:TRINITY_DN9907_c0_g1_i2.p2 TRINITY_DN9907_c0_g1~~TRINITY_DN9907_c0_g1_i2.p2  ORF type:complete len:282 (+),score=58.26 TRINITY_DN9907_c0_g1_i2:52-897(+)